MIGKLLRRLGKIEASEVKTVTWSAAYFFFLLGGYFLLRPVREQFGVRGGLDRVPYLFLGTVAASFLLNPVYGWIVARVPRQRFIPIVYRFFALNLVVFFLLDRTVTGEAREIVGGAFYIWLSVFNLFVVSIFWQVMNDGYRPEQAKRLFGLIGVGGTLGAVVGSFITTRLDNIADLTGLGNDGLVPFLFLGGALGLEGALFALRRLGAEFRESQPDPAVAQGRALGGDAWQGLREFVRSPYLLGIGGWIFAGSILATMLYFGQLGIVESSVQGEAERTQVFGWINFAEQSTVLILQLFFTGRIIQAVGVGKTMMFYPLVAVAGLGALVIAPTLAVLIVVQVLHRGTYYGLGNPAKQALFAVLPRSEKYKAKAVVDTFVKRSGDASAAGLKIATKAAGLGAQPVFWLVAPLGLVAAALGAWLGVERRKRARVLDASDTR